MIDDFSREYPDPEWELNGQPLLLDRHRILHSTSFRRLAYKTQVFLPEQVDIPAVHSVNILAIVQCNT